MREVTAMISYLAVVILILLKINIAISIPIRILRQTKGTRIILFSYQTLIFAFPMVVTIIACHFSNAFDMVFIILALIKFALFRWVLFDEWHVDLKDVQMLWKSNNIGSFLPRTRKRRPSILISCPDNVTKRKWQFGGYRKEIMRTSWNYCRVATSHFFGKYGSLVRLSKIGQIW